MKIRWCLLAVTLLTAGFLTACGGGIDNPFTGTWIIPAPGLSCDQPNLCSGTAGCPEITFEGSRWHDTNGNDGSFSVSGKDPTYTLTISSPAQTLTRQATFVDSFKMRLSTTTGPLCIVDLVLDKSIIPN